MSKVVKGLDEALVYEGNTFEFLVGYRDENGVYHKEFELVEMTGEDEENISRPEVRSNAGKIVTALLSRCIVRIGEYSSKDMKAKAWEEIIRSLFVGDRDFAMMKLRQITKPNEPEISMRPTCPSCRGQFGYMVDVEEDINVITPAEGFDPFEVPFSLSKGVENKKTQKVYRDGTLRLPNGADQEALAVVAARNMGEANTTLITRLVKEIGDAPLNSITFRKMTYGDRENILKTITENKFGPDLSVTVYCPHCGHEFEANVSLADFF